jgi:hypothetical protein
MTTHNICSLGSPTLDLINFARGEAARVVWGRGMLLRFSELYFCAVAKVCIYNTETYIYIHRLDKHELRPIQLSEPFERPTTATQVCGLIAPFARARLSFKMLRMLMPVMQVRFLNEPVDSKTHRTTLSAGLMLKDSIARKRCGR